MELAEGEAILAFHEWNVLFADDEICGKLRTKLDDSYMYCPDSRQDKGKHS